MRIAFVDLFRMRSPSGRALRSSTHVESPWYPVELASISRKLVMATPRNTHSQGEVDEYWFMPFEVVGFDQHAMRSEIDDAMSEDEAQ
jgi:hypothetical protein